jgi:CDP-diacylglycerol--serine O-phosphatidyltransferase
MRQKRKRKPRKRERKGIFLLPNLFTSASLFGGFYAIIAAMQGRYEAAALAIMISGLLDGLDGRIARFTRTTTQFGIEYDSLSDLVAFGVAPAILAYQWALEPFGRLGWLAAFMYVICGALRLARFNVQKNTVQSKNFKGLPIPAAAAFTASLILFSSAVEGILPSRPVLIILMIYGLSFLMVSTVDYMGFKEFDIRKKKPFNALVSIILIFMLVAYKPRIIIFFFMFTYVLSGPALAIYRLHTKRASKKESLAEGAGPQERDESAVLKDQEISGNTP